MAKQIKPTWSMLDRAVAEGSLKEDHYDILSLEEIASRRIQQGVDSYVSKDFMWAKEGVIYFPKGNPKLVRYSPILLSQITSREAAEAHRTPFLTPEEDAAAPAGVSRYWEGGFGLIEHKEFYPTKEQIDLASQDSIDLPQKFFFNKRIPTNRFGEEPITVFAFGGEKQAKAYGELLRNCNRRVPFIIPGVYRMPFWTLPADYVNTKSQPFARPVQISTVDVDFKSRLCATSLWEEPTPTEGKKVRKPKIIAEGERESPGISELEPCPVPAY